MGYLRLDSQPKEDTMNNHRSGHLDIRVDETTAWVTVPTIRKLRVALQEMEAAGVPEHAPLNIAHLANALGTFVISQLNPEEQP